MIQHFRKRPNWNGAGTFTTAVFYDGTNLSEVAALGAEISVLSEQTPNVRHLSGVLVRLPHNMWVIRNNLGPGAPPWAVSVLSTTSMKCMYEGPYSAHEVERMQQAEQEADAENALADEDEASTEPNVLTASVRASSRDDLRAEAILAGRKFFGMDGELKVEFVGPVRCHQYGDGEAQYKADVRITLHP